MGRKKVKKSTAAISRLHHLAPSPTAAADEGVSSDNPSGLASLTFPQHISGSPAASVSQSIAFQSTAFKLPGGLKDTTANKHAARFDNASTSKRSARHPTSRQSTQQTTHSQEEKELKSFPLNNSLIPKSAAFLAATGPRDESQSIAQQQQPSMFGSLFQTAASLFQENEEMQRKEEKREEEQPKSSFLQYFDSLAPTPATAAAADYGAAFNAAPSESSSEVSHRHGAIPSPQLADLISFSDYIVEESLNRDLLDTKSTARSAESIQSDDFGIKMQSAGCNPTEEKPRRLNAAVLETTGTTDEERLGEGLNSGPFMALNDNTGAPPDANVHPMAQTLLGRNTKEIPGSQSPVADTFHRTPRRNGTLPRDTVEHLSIRNAEAPTDPVPPVLNFRRRGEEDASIVANKLPGRSAEAPTTPISPHFNFGSAQRTGNLIVRNQADTLNNEPASHGSSPTSRVAEDPPADLRVVSVVALATTKMKRHYRNGSNTNDNNGSSTSRRTAGPAQKMKAKEKKTVSKLAATGQSTAMRTETAVALDQYAAGDTHDTVALIASNVATTKRPTTSMLPSREGGTTGQNGYCSFECDKEEQLIANFMLGRKNTIATEDLQRTETVEFLLQVPTVEANRKKSNGGNDIPVNLLQISNQDYPPIDVEAGGKDVTTALLIRPTNNNLQLKPPKPMIDSKFTQEEIISTPRKAEETVAEANTEPLNTLHIKSGANIKSGSIGIEAMQNDSCRDDTIIALEPVEEPGWKEQLWQDTHTSAKSALEEKLTNEIDESATPSPFGPIKIRLPNSAPSKAYQLTQFEESTIASTPAGEAYQKSSPKAVITEHIEPNSGLTRQQNASLTSLGSFGSSVKSLESFSATCTFQRGSFSTISSADSASIKKRHERSHSDDSGVASKQSLNQGNFFNLIQSQLEHVFFDELDSNSDNNGEDYGKWLERAKRPTKNWDSKGRVWTKPGAKPGENLEVEMHISPESGECTDVVSETIESKYGAVVPVNNSDPDRMRIRIHQHGWDDSDTESDGSEGSGRHFLGATSRIRRELHKLAVDAEDDSDSSSSNDTVNDNASTDLDTFLRSEGLHDDMIEAIYEEEDRTAWRGRMSEDINQALLELSISGLDFSDEESEESNIVDEKIEDDLDRLDVRAYFMLLKAKQMFKRGIKTKAIVIEQDEDDVSFLSVSSSEADDDEIHRAVNRLAFAQLVSADSVQSGAKVEPLEDDEKSLGSLGEHSTNFKKIEQDYMFLDNYDSFRRSSRKKVEFADDSESVLDDLIEAEVVKRTIFSRLAGKLRLSKKMPSENDSELNRLIDNSDDIEAGRNPYNKEKGDDDDDDDGSHFTPWLEELPEERWDDTDKNDFFGALQIHWEPKPIICDDKLNPYVGFGENGGAELMVHFSDEDDGSSDADSIVQLSIFDKLYGKIPPRRRPVVLLVLFLLVVVFPISYGLSIATKRAFATPATLPPITEAPSSAPTSGFVFKNWTQVGESLVSTDVKAQNGFSLSLSDDGSVLVVGARKSSCADSTNCGSVEIYRFAIVDDAPTWFLMDVLHGGIAGNQFGFSVSLSGNGQRLAVGSIGDDTNGKNSGMVQVFQRFQGIWEMIAEFEGEEAGDLFGVSVSLNRDGRMLAVGAPYHAALGRVQSGQAYFFEDIGFDNFPRWVQSRSIVLGPSARGRFGWSLALSEDASRMIVGAPGDPSLGITGFTRIFEFDGFIDRWVQSGVDMGFRGKGDRFGFSVSMCNSGNRVAVGAYKSKVANTTTGEVFVYQYNEKIWNPLGSSLVGDSEGADFGYAVDLSPEGDFLVVGALNHQAILPTHTNTTGADNATENISTNVSFVATGMARVFNYEGNEWIASEDILGDVEDGDFGAAVRLSSEAARVAVGAPQANQASVFE